MPSTWPSHVPVARNDRRFGILIANFSLVPSGVPTVKMEKDAGFSLS